MEAEMQKWANLKRAHFLDILLQYDFKYCFASFVLNK